MVQTKKGFGVVRGKFDFSFVLGVWVVLWGLTLAGCVPIRQQLSGGGGYSPKKSDSTAAADPSSKSDDTDSISSAPSGKDAWKGEMEGIASWYGEDFNGRLTASGEVYDMYAYTAAHKTLPLGTVVKVTNQDNGQSVEVRINDRGPYVRGRVIDLSRTAGRAIGMRDAGTAKVKLEIVRWPKGR